MSDVLRLRNPEYLMHYCPLVLLQNLWRRFFCKIEQQMHVSETGPELALRRSDHTSMKRGILQSLDLSKGFTENQCLEYSFPHKGSGGSTGIFALHISLCIPTRMPLVPYGHFDLIPVLLCLKVSQGV